MGREGQPHEEYSREAFDEAKDALSVSNRVVGQVYERSAKGRGERAPSSSYAEGFQADVRRGLQQLGDLLGVSDLSAAWEGLENAKRRLEEMKAAGEDETRALNEEFEQRKRAAAQALQDLVVFEREKLRTRGSAETSEDTTVN